ncbi:MAG: DUF423 domain-containing protein [Pseudomonadales bacterium]|nr:DUF423 domain-containing protein [Gammaproteobacteria bacterium]NNL57267.1 DUF423 domain-containing protein [Pseudomonadales bacterium]
MLRITLLAGALFGALAIALGAFGAHALDPRLPDNLFSSFQTAVRYQMWHALALLALGALALQANAPRLLLACCALLMLGTLLFSGSLYTLALTDWRQLGPVKIGWLTPAGGLLLLSGWLLLAVALWRASSWR